MSKIVWIIGASSGIGLELAKLFVQNGDKVIVTSRDAQNAKAFVGINVHKVSMDVSDIASTKEGVKKAWEFYDGIDLCFYNAGVYESMKMQEWNIEHFISMNNINYLGALRVITEVVPLFELQGHGRMVCNASISSYFGLPYGGGYSAPKAALLNLCESLQPELMAKNIELQVINHGFVKTRLTAKNSFEMLQLMESSEAAQKIFKGLQKPYRFEIRFPKFLTSVLYLLKVLPYSLSFALTKKAL